MANIDKLLRINKDAVESLKIIAVFFLALQEYSIVIAGNGVSANYIYVVFPLLFWIIGIKRRMVFRKEVLVILFIYSVIYVAGIPEDMANMGTTLGDPVRRIASFLVFVFPLILALIEFKSQDLLNFKKAIILAALYSSLQHIWLLINLPDISNYFDLKGEVGSQRYGFVLCAGMFLVLFDNVRILQRWFLFQKAAFGLIIFIGLVITFSRSSIVSLFGAVVILMMVWPFKRLRFKSDGLKVVFKRSSGKVFYPILITVVIALLYIGFQNFYNQDFLSFYESHFIKPLMDGTLINHAENIPQSSEGTRMVLLKSVFEYLSSHPLFGSGYQGLYLLFEEYKGGMSTHNQYADIMLRTGLLGFVVWLYLLFRIVRFCWQEKGLFAGLMAILIYGLVQETFKLSQGSFIFGMLLSFSYLRLCQYEITETVFMKRNSKQLENPDLKHAIPNNL